MNNWENEPKLNVTAQAMKTRYNGRLIKFGELLNLMENDNLEMDTEKFDYYHAHFKYSDQRNFHTTRFLPFNWKYLSRGHDVRLGPCVADECTPEELNHIAFTLDKITMAERIKADDVAVMEIVREFPLELISDYLQLAIEANSDQLTAGLMNLKHDREKQEGVKIEVDPFSEFDI